MREELRPYIPMTVAVSKYRTPEEILARYNEGYRLFAENRVQELLKRVSIPMEGVKWHLIGHLQSNKVRSVLPYVELIHSVDSEKLLRLIDREAARIGKTQSVLIQVNVAKEDTKFGISAEELVPLIKKCEDLEHVSIEGIMVIGPHTDNKEEIRRVFREGRRLFEEGYPLTQKNVHWKTLSMGMSSDWKIAVEEGSTLLRLGRILFTEEDPQDI